MRAVAVVWGVGGVVLLLAVSVWRLSAPASELLTQQLGAVHLIVLALWSVFMVYAEAWRGFHKQFSPRVVQRAFTLPIDRPALVALAPAVCMGLLHATRKRRIVAWSLVIGIALIVLVVRQLDQPWRGVIDAGVVLGLAGGTASVLWFGVRAAGGQLPGVEPDWPEVG